MSGEPLADVPAPRPVVGSQVVLDGLVFDVVRDQVQLTAEVVTRDRLSHPGAVAVIVLDAQDQVLLLRQYRHAVGAELWEPPAGLLDVPGEPAHVTAARELAEEVDLVADSWWRLVTFWSSPGYTDERIQVFVARDVHPVPDGERHQRHGEEAEMVTRWVPLDDALDAVMAGRVHNPSAVVGLLAAVAARSRGWADLTPVNR